MLITGSMLLSIAVYALTTSKDFTKGRGILTSYIVSFITYSIVSYKWGFSFSVFFGLVGVLLASIYLISDIQSITSGRRDDITPDDYIMASMILYLDVLVIFTAVLQLCGACKK